MSYSLFNNTKIHKLNKSPITEEFTQNNADDIKSYFNETLKPALDRADNVPTKISANQRRIEEKIDEIETLVNEAGDNYQSTFNPTKPKHMLDEMNKDKKLLNSSDSQTYILGTITIATLIIFIINIRN
jgi:hypothetical protein|tara:strand:- start:1927 stop:2313 length:387 start_codon:yes stop_codon:yes gene_type:complete